MPIPDFQSLMLPVLEVAADGQEHAGSALIAKMVDRFGLTEAERAELLPSGRQLRFGVGVRIEERVEIKKIDEDYFSIDA